MNHEDLEITLDKDLEEQLLIELLEDELDNGTIDDVSDEEENDKTVIKPKKKKRRKITSKKIKEHLKIRTVILLLLTLLVNTYAWFIYVSSVSTSISIHVKSWEFELSNEGKNDENFVFAVDEMYPGMPDKSQEITANNKGETDASLSCVIKSIRIFENTYIAGETTYEDEGVTKTYTSEDLLNMISQTNDYPFKVKIYFDDVEFTGENKIMKTGDSTIIKFIVTWPYETGDPTNKNEIELNDITDTKWGNKAYQYHLDNPTEECIEIKVQIEATQLNEESEVTP